MRLEAAGAGSRDVAHDARTECRCDAHRQPFPEPRSPRIRTVVRRWGRGQSAPRPTVPRQRLVDTAPLPLEAMRAAARCAPAKVEGRNAGIYGALHHSPIEEHIR